MMSRIDPIRRADLLRRATRPDPVEPEEATEAEIVRLPVPVDRVSRILPRDEPSDGQSAFAAQLMGQDGAKRGLRAGPEVIDSAKSLYNRTEWSGSKDRRAPNGGRARTKI
ncbi:MAG: hypothetical protein JWP49_42 [Phenylobacterium sp.]|jgi:hypothetical protein|nr:hypothetical protein [Phenylobacterium sp.]